MKYVRETVYESFHECRDTNTINRRSKNYSISIMHFLLDNMGTVFMWAMIFSFSKTHKTTRTV